MKTLINVVLKAGGAETGCCSTGSDKIWLTDRDGNIWEVLYAHDESEPDGESCCMPSKQENADSHAASSCCAPPKVSGGCCG